MNQNRSCCVYCKYWCYEPAEEDWSEITPGNPPHVGCSKGIWEMDAYKDTQSIYFKKMTTSLICDKFEGFEK